LTTVLELDPPTPLIERVDRHGIVRIATAMVLTQGISIGTGAALSVLLARWLGPDKYGRYLFALAIAQTLAIPMLAGLPTLVTRQIAIYRAKQDWARLRGVLRWSLNVLSVTGGLITLAAIAYVLFFGGGTEIRRAYLLALPMTVCLVAMRLASAVIQGYERPFWGNLPDTAIRPVLLLIFAAGAAITGLLTPAVAMGGHIVATVLAAAWAFLYWRRHLATYPAEAPGCAPLIENRVWLLSLLPLSLLTTGSLINTRLDVLMLGFLAEKSQVALYGVAMQLAGLAALSRTIVLTIAGPRFARLWAEGSLDELRSLIRSTKLFNLLGAAAVALAIATIGEPVITLLTGSAYHESARYAALLCVPIISEAVMGPSALLLVMSGNERVSARLVWCMAAINGALNAVLIPRMGIMGAIITTFVCEFFWQASSLLAARWLLGVNTLWPTEELSARHHHVG
jgi:O-antigen/teichoic acid export membrane protein